MIRMRFPASFPAIEAGSRAASVSTMWQIIVLYHSVDNPLFGRPPTGLPIDSAA